MLTELAPELDLALVAAHYDHRLDAGSDRRARRARVLAARLGVRCVVGRRGAAATPGESPEAAARRLRYRFLERARRRLGACLVLTAHHLDDQAETVLMRLAFGTGIEGLAGIRPRRGHLLRPLLEATREQLHAHLELRGLEALEDPTNADRRLPRSRLRHDVLPRLEADDPAIAARLSALAAAARRARPEIERLLAVALDPFPVYGGLATRRARLEALDPVLVGPALALLHRRAGAPYPARAAARSELVRQLARGARIGCDAGGGWRWEQRGGLVVLGQEAPPIGAFSYTLRVPGELTIPDLGLVVRVRRAERERRRAAPEPELRAVAGFERGAPQRDVVRLALPLAAGDRLTVRNRRPGDRIRPAGSSRERRLKEVLIDRKVPRAQRDELPLVCAGRNIAWVVGVTIDERFRARESGDVWELEVEPA